ncbi:MAG TPA: hypothetical protein VKB51_06640, partial [bacterium]|nr:hypothetical protein [bacterium]
RMVLADEDASEFEQLRRNLHAELCPETQLEVLIVNRIAAVQWRLARVPALEAELMDRLRYDMLTEDQGLGGAWSLDSGPYGGALARLARYETTLERNAARLTAELRRSQAHRRQQERAELAQLAAERERAARERDLRDVHAWRGEASGWPGDGSPTGPTPPPLPSGAGGSGDGASPLRNPALRNEANAPAGVAPFSAQGALS